MESYEGAYFGALGREIDAFWGDGGWRAAYGGGGCVAYGSVAANERTHGGTDVPNERPYADTIFFGGGTPSSVDARRIARTLEKIPRVPSAECTIEVNPGTADRHKLQAYRAAGFNRLSIGLQSSHAAHLKMLGRIHTFEDFIDNLDMAREAGFDNINADLLFGLPGQTMAEWARTLESVVVLRIRHLSCYSLSLAEDTPLEKAVAGGALETPDEDLDREMYAFAASYLQTAGIYQYELSNFAEPGRECRHNLKYWTGARYRGFGAGAHSYDGFQRYSNAGAIPEYIKMTGASQAGAGPPGAAQAGVAAPAAAFAAVVQSEYIDQSEKEKEFIILRLRLTRGFCDGEFRESFGRGFLEKYAAEASELAAAGLLDTSRDGRVSLTPKGRDLANRVFVRFI